ncbi:MAG TPA: phosphocholine cytidylyltransferase family protein, partial [Bacteroidota bacterium]
MKCIILAAGASTRLRPVTDSIPKCLLPVGKKTILQRCIESLHRANISQIGIVVGFEAGKIRSHLQQQFPGKKFKVILNPNFATTNNAYSLLLGREFFLNADSKTNVTNDLMILDSDVIFHPGLLQFLLRNADANKIAVRVTGAHDEEEVGVVVDGNGDVSGIGKDVNIQQKYGESVGIACFSVESANTLFEVLERRVRRGNGRTEYYESAFQELIDRGVKIRAIDVSKYPSLEIDSPA